MAAQTVYHQGWSLNEVSWDMFQPEAVDPTMLAAIKAAALVEYNAPDYVTYLKRVFRDSGSETLANIERWGQGRKPAWPRARPLGGDRRSQFQIGRSLYAVPQGLQAGAFRRSGIGRLGPGFAQLSKTEFDLLELLLRNEGIVLDHSTVYQRIWGYDFGADSKNLAVYIGYLRRKLSAAGAPTLIHTVRGVGYTVRQP